MINFPNGFAYSNGIAQVLEHLAAEVMAAQHMCGAMDAHELARMLLKGASSQRVTPLHPMAQQSTSGSEHHG